MMEKNEEQERYMKPLGIYDNSSDLHRAINLSNGYYGDWSSLVALYGATGKPIVIQDVNAVERDVLEPRKLMFADFAIDDDGSAWAFDLFYDGLFKLDFVQHSAQLVARSECFPQLDSKKIISHRYIHVVKNGLEVICFPYFSRNIMIYDNEKQNVKFININTEYITKNTMFDGFMFDRIIEFNNKYYVFGYQCKAILVMDKSNHLISYHSKMFGKIASIIYNKEHFRYPLYISEPTKDGWIKLLLLNTNIFLNYNLLSQDYEIIQSNIGIKGVDLAEFSDDSLWMFDSHKKTLMDWNIKKNTISGYKLECNEFKAGSESMFSAICDCGEKLLLFPSFSNMVVAFDKKNHYFSNFIDLPILSDDIITFKYDRPKRKGDKIFAFARFNSTIYEIDTKGGKISNHIFKFAENDIFKTIDVYKIPVDVKESGIDGSNGKQIYEYTRSLVSKQRKW